MFQQTPSMQQNTYRPDSPPVVKNVHSNPSYRSNNLAEARLAVLRDVGEDIPEISLEKFLKFFAPAKPDFNLHATMRSLKSGTDPVLSPSDRWTDFIKTPKDSPNQEDKVFSPMPNIFTKVVAAIITNSDGNLNTDSCTVDLLQNPTQAPTSAERHNETKPDGYLVLKKRIKAMSKDLKKEDIRWADIVLSCEYKRKDGPNDLDDVRIHQDFNIACWAHFSY